MNARGDRTRLVGDLVDVRRRHRPVVELAQDAPEWTTTTGGIGSMLHELAGDDVERARRVSVIVERRAAAGAPPNQLDVVRGAAIGARRIANAWARLRNPAEICDGRMAARERGEQARWQRKRCSDVAAHHRGWRGRLDDLHDVLLYRGETGAPRLIAGGGVPPTRRANSERAERSGGTGARRSSVSRGPRRGCGTSRRSAADDQARVQRESLSRRVSSPH